LKQKSLPAAALSISSQQEFFLAPNTFFKKNGARFYKKLNKKSAMFKKILNKYFP